MSFCFANIHGYHCCGRSTSHGGRPLCPKYISHTFAVNPYAYPPNQVFIFAFAICGFCAICTKNYDKVC